MAVNLRTGTSSQIEHQFPGNDHFESWKSLEMIILIGNSKDLSLQKFETDSQCFTTCKDDPRMKDSSKLSRSHIPQVEIRWIRRWTLLDDFHPFLAKEVSSLRFEVSS